MLLARFLIEDNEEEYLELDMERMNEIVVIRSIFRTLVGNYAIMEENEENEIKKLTEKVRFSFDFHLIFI